MKRKKSRRYILFGLAGFFLGAVAAVWFWYAGTMSPSFRAVMRGSKKSNDRVSLTGGNLVVLPPDPGIFFGTVRRPDEERQFTYVVYFEYEVSAELLDDPIKVESHTDSEGSTMATHNSLSIGEKRIEAVYRLEFDDTMTTIERESLTLNGDVVDVSLGRVFLMDLAEDDPDYQQIQSELPVIDQRMETTEDVEQVAKTIKPILKRTARNAR